MFANDGLTEEEQRKIRIEILRMKNKASDEIFSDEYRKNNPFAFEYYFEKNYKEVLRETVHTGTPNSPTIVLYYNESKKDGKVFYLPDNLEIHPLELRFQSIDELRSSINQPYSQYYDQTYKNIINKYEELSGNTKNTAKMKM